MPIEADIARLKKLIVGLSAIVTAMIALLTLILTGAHTTVDQIRNLENDFRRHPPATITDLTTAKQQIQSTTTGVLGAVNGVENAIHSLPAPKISVTAPPNKPTTINVTTTQQPAPNKPVRDIPPPTVVKPQPSSTPSPTPSLTCTPSLFNLFKC